MSMPCWVVFIHSAKPSAASWFLPPLGSENAEPPFSAVAVPPAVYCGSGATDHLPDEAWLDDSRMPGHQAPERMVAYLPSVMFLVHALDQPGVLVSTSLPPTSWFSTASHFWVPASWKLTVTLVPLTTNG